MTKHKIDFYTNRFWPLEEGAVLIYKGYKENKDAPTPEWIVNFEIIGRPIQ